MAMTTTLFKAHAMAGGSTGKIMERINRELARDNAAEMFVTIFAGILDLATGAVEYSDGGHEAPFIVRAGGAVDRLDKHQGMALGVRSEEHTSGLQSLMRISYADFCLK